VCARRCCIIRRACLPVGKLELGACPDKYREYFFFQEKKYREKIKAKKVKSNVYFYFESF